MVPPENAGHEVAAVDIHPKAQRSAIIERNHEVEVGSGTSRAPLQEQQRQLLESINIRNGRRRSWKQSVKGNEDVRTPSTLDLVLALVPDLHRRSEAL
jgi:hypothetical protein